MHRSDIFRVQQILFFMRISQTLENICFFWVCEAQSRSKEIVLLRRVSAWSLKDTFSPMYIWASLLFFHLMIFPNQKSVILSIFLHSHQVSTRFWIKIYQLDRLSILWTLSSLNSLLVGSFEGWRVLKRYNLKGFVFDF